MKKIKLLVPAIMLMVFFLASCQPKVDLNKEKEDILNYLKKADKANFDRNVDAWVALYAENCVYPSNGEVFYFTRDSIRKNTEKSFSNKNFKLLSIAEISKPIIHISADATMAWYIVNSTFNYTIKDSTGNEKPYSSQIAALFVLEKKNSEWVEVTGNTTYKKKK